MTRDPYILLTGATGLLGRYLVRDLSLAGVSLAVLVRPSRRQSPAARVEAMLRAWDEELGYRVPRPVVLAGDIARPDLGLSVEHLKWTAENCSAIVHNAASLQFVSTSRAGEPWRSNVDGVQNVLDFCRESGISTFHHVSTAYVAGLREGRVYENELDEGQEFGNDYERSKVEAEKHVRGSDFLDSLTVFRPGIIIGDSRTGMTTTFHNFYAMLQLAWVLLRQMGGPDFTGKQNSAEVHFNVDGVERKHLVPVDWVSEVMAHVITHPELHGQTYHLTPRCPIMTRLMRDVLEEVLDFYGVDFYGAGEQRDDPSEAEALFHQQLQVYSSYWRDDPEFDFSNVARAVPHLPCPHVDRAMMTRLARAAIESGFSWSDPPVSEEELVDVESPLAAT